VRDTGLPHICIPLLVFCNPGWYWFYRHISSRPALHLHPLAGFLHPQLVLVLQNPSHVGLPHICIPLLVCCTPGQYSFYRCISCRPAPHLHLLANSLHPQPVLVLQTHLMSACTICASPCQFFAPQAGAGSTHTSQIGLNHICIHWLCWPVLVLQIHDLHLLHPQPVLVLLSLRIFAYPFGPQCFQRLQTCRPVLLWQYTNLMPVQLYSMQTHLPVLLFQSTNLSSCSHFVIHC